MEHGAVGQFGRDLTEVVRHARAVGARVLVADLPRFGGVDVAPYNAAIARVARAQGATLVPLHDLQIGTLGGGPELRPDVEGHRKIADAFEAALRG